MEQITETWEAFQEKFKTFLIKERNWSINKAYKYEDNRIKECFEKGMSVIDTFFEVLTGSVSD
ncbi:hypothetical protein [Pedobacter sp. R-06]|uniref:hypothetical protein n=1 Tax=Pedobacter sp. R-06 TaxID=3404051 RepID=UPI003CFB0BC9